MKTRTKALLLALCAVLLVVTTVFTTLAFLKDETGEVTNVFTVGKVSISLFETDPENSSAGQVEISTDVEHTYAKVVPGVAIPKDPTLKVNKGSEASWLFAVVTVDNAQFDYEIADGWTKVENVANLAANETVYVREVDAVAEDAEPIPSFPIFKDNEVTLKTDFAGGEINDISIIGKAIQKDTSFGTALAAWNAMQAELNG